MDKIQYHTYTVADLKAWIIRGENNGLSERIISLARANALMHCPYVQDDDVVVISAMDGDEVVGYTDIFSEYLLRPDMWIATGTTLWVNPDYADDFVGYNLVQRLWQAYPQYSVIGSDVSRPAAMIDKLLGASILKYERHGFVFHRNIQVHSLRNLASRVLEPYRIYRQRKAVGRVMAIIPANIRVIARDTIDAEAYDFICAHSESDTFLRSREMLNWILRYPFSVENPLMKYAVKSNAFSDQVGVNRNYLLQIYMADTLIGIVMLGFRGKDMHVKMLYTDTIHQEVAFALIIDTMINSSIERLYSLYPELNAFIAAHQVALRDTVQPLLFTYPKSIKCLEPFVLQGIDGDMFA